MTSGRTIEVDTKGYSDVVDVTGHVQRVIKESGIDNGLVNVSVIGSTASVSTIEFEPALTADFKDAINDLAPADRPTRHGDTWGDDNGFSHIRATFMGPGITLPVVDAKALLGTWQQIVVLDHDNRPRTRRVRVQVIGE